MKNIHTELKKILLTHRVGTQAEITQLLKQQGIDATQSNISRALKKIGAIKYLDEQGKSIYKIPRKQLQATQLLSGLIAEIVDNGYAIIIKTHPGGANAVAQLIDERSLDLILGTVAGDNSILILPKSADKTKTLTVQLKQLLSGNDT